MSVQQEPINLYIHPDNGPITSMELDMLAIELSVIQSDTTYNRDNAKLNAIIVLIKKSFPKVQPEACRQQLRLLISRLVHVSIYDGIVLRLPGTIDGPPPPPSYTQADIEKLQEEISILISELASTRQIHTEQSTKDRTEIEALRLENEALRAAGRVWQDEKRNLNSELDKAEDEKYEAEMKVNEYFKQKTDLQEKIAEMQEEVEKERHERAVVVNLQRDIATLRNELREAKEIEKQLSAAYSKLEQENKELREKLRQCIEDETQPNPLSNKSDSTKGPWLD